MDEGNSKYLLNAYLVLVLLVPEINSEQNRPYSCPCVAYNLVGETGTNK